MTCLLTNAKTNESFIAIDELLSLEFKGGIVRINGIVELRPEEILKIVYERKTKK